MNRLIPSFTPQRSRLSKEKIDAVKTAVLPKYEVSSFDDIQGWQNVNLEIGAGFGDTITHLAKNNPTSMFIACEVYIDALSSICKRIERENLANIKVYANDARELINQMPNDFLIGVYVLFPDPWPKTRHVKRRIINAEFLQSVSRVLKSGAMLFIATDHDDYKFHIKKVVGSQAYFEVIEQVEEEPSWWVRTKYQEKAIAQGRQSTFFTLRKLARVK